MLAGYPPQPEQASYLDVEFVNARVRGWREFSSQPKGTDLLSWSQIGTNALISGSIASVVSTFSLALLAKAEGRKSLQPVNATSHWLHGDEAGRTGAADVQHTAVGYATHHASAVFWAFVFETLRARRHKHDTASICGDAAIVSALAAAVDYGIVPKRFTPGWETVLDNRSVAAGFIALAGGLALGGMLTNSSR